MRFSMENKQIEREKCEHQEIEEDELPGFKKFHVRLF